MMSTFTLYLSTFGQNLPGGTIPSLLVVKIVFPE